MQQAMDTEKDDFPLLKHLDELVDDLRREVDAALAGEDVDAVHDSRVATRRLKAATELMNQCFARLPKAV